MTPRAAAAAVRDLRFVEGVVANLEVFRDVAPLHLVGVVRQCSALTVRRGAAIALRNTRLPGIFALAYGSVELALGGAGNERRVIRLLSAGETFGKATALLGRASRYEATALVHSKLVVIPSAAIVGLMERDAQFARSMVMALAGSTFNLLAELEAATMQRGAQRLAVYLASLAEPGGAPGPCTVKLPVSKTVVAARLGVTKETLSRLLRDFANEGLISVAQRTIAILDSARLAGIAQPN
jgi:CRP/FNR family transcriptional regulator, dissimilatory nitrate respiration regulator